MTPRASHLAAASHAAAAASGVANAGDDSSPPVVRTMSSGGGGVAPTTYDERDDTHMLAVLATEPARSFFHGCAFGGDSNSRGIGGGGARGGMWAWEAEAHALAVHMALRRVSTPRRWELGSAKAPAGALLHIASARGESGRDEAGKDRFGGGACWRRAARTRGHCIRLTHTTPHATCCLLHSLPALSLSLPPRFPPSTGWLALAPPHLLCSAPFGSRPPRVSGRRPRPSLTLPSRTSTARPSYGHSGSSWRTCAAMSRPLAPACPRVGRRRAQVIDTPFLP